MTSPPCRRLAARLPSTVVSTVWARPHAWRKAAQHVGPKYAENYVDKIQWEISVDRALSDAVPVLRMLVMDSEEIAAMAHDLVEKISSDAAE
jgi:hypothetical protein